MTTTTSRQDPRTRNRIRSLVRALLYSPMIGFGVYAFVVALLQHD